MPRASRVDLPTGLRQRPAADRQFGSPYTHDMNDISHESISANDAGVALADAGRYSEALAFYEEALSLAPTWYAPHLNIGIACKHVGDWERSLAACLRAWNLDAQRAGSGALWNVGVAATALGDWSHARWAWANVGIAMPEGEGPIDLNIGAKPIRVNVSAYPEVVWCHRIDPARARIESIPTPESGRRYGDLLLHDGEPRGKRRYGEQLCTVFDEFAVLQVSPFRTWKIEIAAPSEQELDELFRAVAEGSEAACEDWTANLEALCRHCSEGTPHEHARKPEHPWKRQRTVAVATVDDTIFAIVETWALAGGGRSVSHPVLVTP